MKRIAQIEKSYLRDDIPAFGSGDTLRVHVKIKEGDKERIQVFQGTVIGRRGSGTGETFTVRKISSGIGVERIFPLNSPNIAKIEKVRSGSVRRGKLYYLRGLTGKSARIKEELSDKAEMNESSPDVQPEDVKPAEPVAAEAPSEEKKETREPTAAVETAATAESVSEKAPEKAAAEKSEETPEKPEDKKPE